MTDGQRNIAIVFLIAVAAVLVNEVSAGIDLIGLLVSILFLVVITLALWQFFQRNRTTIAGMDPAKRFVLLASGVGLYVASLGLMFGLVGGYLFFGVLALSVLGMYWAWTSR